jgi:hypothetical protein
MRSLLRIAVGAAALLSCFVPARAGAQAGPSPDESTVLFREGRILLNKGHFAEACEKFRASLERKRTPGTLLNVANCLESSGDVVAALESVEEALDLAAREPDQRKSAAWTAAGHDEIAALEPRVARVTVHSNSDPAPAVTLDGLPLSKFDQPLRLNPGQHNLEAAAPRRRPFAKSFEVVAGQTQVLTIPELDHESSAAVPAASVPAASVPDPALESPRAVALPSAAVSSGSSPQLLPWLVTGAGAALFSSGAIAGLVARGMASDLKRDCPGHVCKSDLSEPQRTARTALVADVLMGAGLVGLGVGVALFVTESDATTQHVDVACGPYSCGARVRGQF